MSRSALAAALAACAIALASLAVDVATIPLPFLLVPIAQLPISLVGALLIARLPRNRVGWLLATSGVVFAVMFALSGYAWWSLSGAFGGHLPGGDIAAAIATALSPPALGAAILALLYFPSGAGPGGRWRWVERLLLGIIVFGSIGTMFGARAIDVGGPGEAIHFDANPLMPAGLPGAIFTALAHLMDPVTAPLMLLAPASLIARYRRSDAVQRQQIRLLVYVTAITFVVLVASNVTQGDVSNTLWLVSLCSFALVPIAIGIAIFRYRLYDIDVLINRTLVYGALSGMLGLVYFAAVVVSQTLLGPLTRGSELGVAVSTLLVVALFQPLRRRIQDAVDRRFARSRYDAARALDAFARRMGDEVDLDAVRAELVSAVRDTVRPAHASIWLRGRT